MCDVICRFPSSAPCKRHAFVQFFTPQVIPLIELTGTTIITRHKVNLYVVFKKHSQNTNILDLFVRCASSTCGRGSFNLQFTSGGKEWRQSKIFPKIATARRTFLPPALAATAAAAALGGRTARGSRFFPPCCLPCLLTSPACRSCCESF